MSKTRILCAALALHVGLATAAPPVPQALRAVLDDFGVPDEHLGLYIVPVDGLDDPVSLNADAPFNPASVIKLLPSLAALESFTPAYQWSTTVYTTGGVTNGTLNGHLYIKGGGDPYLTVESLWSLLSHVRARGIDAIAGDIVLDESVFELPPFDRAAFDDKPHRLYNGPANGLMVNFWGVQFTVSAASDSVSIDAFPGSQNLRIVNNIEHSSERCTRANRYVDYRAKETAEAVVVTFTGRLSSRCPPVILSRAVVPSERYLQYVLPDLWRAAGGTLKGSVRKGAVPDGASRIYTHPSRSMAEIVQATNKFSNNMMARHLLLTLGTLYKDRGVRVADGIKALQDWLKANWIEVPGLEISNGSGLSRDTRVSARGLANVLRAGISSRYAPEFLASFPIAGEDWAMDGRPFGHDISIVRVKTGLIDHVRAMAGYITTRKGRTYIAVLLVNRNGVHQGLGTRMQNEVIGYILGQ